MEDRIKRFKTHEETLDQMTALTAQLTVLTSQWETLLPKYRDLMAYYQNAQWIEDVEVDNEGAFQELKRGVLSQDAIYNLYLSQRDLNFKISRLALDYLEL